MSTIAEQLQEAADKATRASAQAGVWATGPVGTTVSTDSGPVPTIAEFTRAAQTRADDAIAALGWVLAGDFTTGCTVTERNQYVMVVGGDSYRWDGVLPKVVAPGSSPTPIATGGWVVIRSTSGDLASVNASLLPSAFSKIKQGACSIVCVGDSITYGHDTVSPGTIPPVPPHVRSRVAIPYPEQMVINLNGAFGVSGNSVINRGFSGDTVKSSYLRWTAPTSADLAILMFGINDAIDGSGGLSVDEYSTYLQLTIERYISWGSAVALSVPTLMSRGNEPREVYKYRSAAISIAKRYGCPVFKGYEVGSQNYTSEIYSDSVHFNQDGYYLFGSAITSFILGGGLLLDEVYITADDTSPVGYLSRTATNGIVSSSSGSQVIQELIIRLTKGTGQRATYSFYVDGEAADVYVTGQILAGCNVSFDFGSIAGRATRKHIDVNTTPGYTVNSDTVRDSGNTDAFLGSVVGKGWHSVSISSPPSSSVSHAFINSFSISTKKQIECTGSAWSINSREFSLFDPEPSLLSLPSPSSTSSFALPAYLFGSLLYRGPGYFASPFITVEIKSFSGGSHAYTRQIITLESAGASVLFKPILIDSVGSNAVSVSSVTGQTREVSASSGPLTFNLSRPAAGYIEIRFTVPDMPDIRYAGMV